VDPDPGDPKTCGSGSGFGSGSATLEYRVVPGKIPKLREQIFQIPARYRTSFTYIDVFPGLWMLVFHMLILCDLFSLSDPDLELTFFGLSISQFCDRILESRQSCELNPSKIESPAEACANAEFLLQVTNR
jgi:hypothetical protein